MTQLWQLSAADLSAAIDRGEVSPVEILDSVLGQITRHNPALNAIVALDAEAAAAAAREAEARARAKRRAGPLDGIPVTIKDNIFVHGFGATWGSRLYRDFRPERDDICVARLRAAGAVIVGKTNTPEFAAASHTDNLVFGPTRSPWNSALTPGGSSGGAVAALAAGMGPISLGTDAGGSIRRPAGLTGTVGLRPSTGRIARLYGFPATAFDFQAISPAARTVTDACLLLDAIAGPHPGDRASLALAPARVAPDLDRPPTRLRIRFVANVGGGPIEPDVAANVAAAVKLLAELGHEVEEGPAPYDVAEIDELHPLFFAAGVARIVAAHRDWREQVGAGALALAERGEKLGTVRYVQALDRVFAMRREFAEAMSAFDVLVTPTSAALAWPIGQVFPNPIGGKEAGPRAAASFASFVNIVGHPGISIPVAPAANGLPIGMQLVGRFGEDATILRLARQFESARPWAQRWPAMVAG